MKNHLAALLLLLTLSACAPKPASVSGNTFMSRHDPEVTVRVNDLFEYKGRHKDEYIIEKTEGYTSKESIEFYAFIEKEKASYPSMVIIGISTLRGKTYLPDIFSRNKNVWEKGAERISGDYYQYVVGREDSTGFLRGLSRKTEENPSPPYAIKSIARIASSQRNTKFFVVYMEPMDQDAVKLTNGGQQNLPNEAFLEEFKRRATGAFSVSE